MDITSKKYTASKNPKRGIEQVFSSFFVLSADRKKIYECGKYGCVAYGV